MNVPRFLPALLATLLAAPAWAQSTTQPLNLKLPPGDLPAVSSTAAVPAHDAAATTTGVGAFFDTTNNKIVLTSDANITLAAANTPAAKIGFDGTEDATAATATGITTLDISSYSGAQSAIKQADAALKQVNSARATLGALQSRFESAVSNIQIASENTTAARSRIMDADFAQETANMTRAQILQQAGNAMLSQANQLPQQVLSLLK